jgi:YidC/Oxa1 family membrane protein insertase
VKNFSLFGIDLTASPKDVIKEAGVSLIILIPILAGVTSLLTAAYSYLKQRKTNPEMAKNPAMGCMTLFSPLLSIWFSIALPAGVGVYWILSNVLAFAQLIILDIAIKPEDIIAGQMIDETVERRSKEESIKKRIALMEAQENERG